ASLPRRCRAARRQLREQLTALRKKLLRLVHDDGECRHLMTVPGGAGVARHDRCSGAFCRLQGGRCRAWADTGTASIGRDQVERIGKVSPCGDGMLCSEAAQSTLARGTKWS